MNSKSLFAKHVRESSTYRFALCVVLLVLSAADARAQRPKGQPLQAWQVFSSNEARFTVEMPGTPLESTQSIFTQNTYVQMHLHILKRAVDVYIVSYIDFPEATNDPKLIQQAFDGGRDRMLRTSKRAVVVKESPLRMGNVSGRELHIEDGVSQLRHRMYYSRGRLFQVTYIIPDPRNATEGLHKFYNENADRFFRSFTISGIVDKRAKALKT